MSNDYIINTETISGDLEITNNNKIFFDRCAIALDKLKTFIKPYVNDKEITRSLITYLESLL